MPAWKEGRTDRKRKINHGVTVLQKLVSDAVGKKCLAGAHGAEKQKVLVFRVKIADKGKAVFHCFLKFCKSSPS